MKRRNFIVLTAAGTVAIGASYWYLRYYDQDYVGSIAEPESLSYIWDSATIMDIGSDYRKQIPEEDSERSLLKLLLADTNDEVSAIAALKKRIISDFETENTIQLDGWILSVTEARQCALFSINNAA